MWKQYIFPLFYLVVLEKPFVCYLNEWMDTYKYLFKKCYREEEIVQKEEGIKFKNQNAQSSSARCTLLLAAKMSSLR
jgi:hypothetical protein